MSTDPDPSDEQQSKLVWMADAIVALIGGALMAVYLAAFWMPSVYAWKSAWWFRYLACGAMLWLVSRALPDAWRHRRDDFQGLVFVFIAIGIFASCLYYMLTGQM
jgi:hypothetical protein